jgi:hypothetical protein
MQLLDRLTSSKSNYNVQELLRNHKKNGNLVRSISTQPFVISHSPSQNIIEKNSKNARLDEFKYIDKISWQNDLKFLKS